MLFLSRAPLCFVRSETGRVEIQHQHKQSTMYNRHAVGGWIRTYTITESGHFVRHCNYIIRQLAQLYSIRAVVAVTDSLWPTDYVSPFYEGKGGEGIVRQALDNDNGSEDILGKQSN